MSGSWASRLWVGRRSLLAGTGLVLAAGGWTLGFYVPQTHKLASVEAKRVDLQAQLAADQARLQHLKNEAHHVAQIRLLRNQLEGYVPTAENLYTYIRTISGAAKVADVSIASLQPGALEAVTGTAYSAIPITASVKGTYDHVVAFLNQIYGLPRLTDVNAVTLTGGGPGAASASILSVSLELAIFTSQKPAPVP